MSKSFYHLRDFERARIMFMYANGLSISAIARYLDRCKSTISRELRRNGHGGMYSSELTHARSIERRQRCKSRKLWNNRRLEFYVTGRLKQGWSPEQISGRLSTMISKDSPYSISHETIYASIYALPRGELRKELIACLTRGRSSRKSRSRRVDKYSSIPDLRPISERPQEVQDRQMPGHWEGDLIKGKKSQSSVGTVVERTSRYLIMVQVDDATSAVVTGGFERELSPIPPHLLRSLTYDRGSEMAQYKNMAKALNLDVYFADPYAPWQRGTNENTNGIIRRFLPKGTDLSPYTQEDLNEIAEKINNIPRKCLGFKKPKEVFNQIIRQNNIQNVALQN